MPCNACARVVCHFAISLDRQSLEVIVVASGVGAIRAQPQQHPRNIRGRVGDVVQVRDHPFVAPAWRFYTRVGWFYGE